VKKQAPASIIYEDETVIVFLDKRPLNEGHTLVIPKKHYVDIFDIPENQLSQVHKVAQQVSVAVKKATKADGISIIQQNGWIFSYHLGWGSFLRVLVSAWFSYSCEYVVFD
jgi:histidine triad (HIT) family protein